VYQIEDDGEGNEWEWFGFEEQSLSWETDMKADAADRTLLMWRADDHVVTITGPASEAVEDEIDFDGVAWVFI